MAVGVGIFGVAVALTRKPSVVAAPSAEPARAPTVDAPPPAPPAPPPTASAAAPEASASAEPPTPVVEEPVRRTRARWSATVKKADGVALPKGTACGIEATLEARGPNATVPGLVVTCGRTKLYDAADEIAGNPKRLEDPREALGARDDKSVFTIEFRDAGARKAPLTQIGIDSRKGVGLVWRDGPTKMRVELDVKTDSAPAPALSGPLQRVRRKGKVAETTGTAPVKKDAACLFRAMPTGQGTHCVAEVTCGKTVLVPASAPVRCTFVGARPATVAGPASPSLHLVGDELTSISTRPPYKVVIRLDPP